MTINDSLAILTEVKASVSPTIHDDAYFLLKTLRKLNRNKD